MNRRFLPALVIFAVVSGTAFSQTTERTRSFYFDTGIGFGGIRYPASELNDAFELLKDNGYDQMTFSLDVSIGGALLQNLYMVGTIAGIGDSYNKSSDYIQMTTVLVGVGIRFYPLPSKKYLQLGADAGFGQMSLDTNIKAVQSAMESDLGQALKFSLAYDFDTTMTGFTLLLGSEVLLAFIEGETVTGYSVFLKLAFK
jgi:hypothetical protein